MFFFVRLLLHSLRVAGASSYLEMPPLGPPPPPPPPPPLGRLFRLLLLFIIEEDGQSQLPIASTRSRRTQGTLLRLWLLLLFFCSCSCTYFWFQFQFYLYAFLLRCRCFIFIFCCFPSACFCCRFCFGFCFYCFFSLFCWSFFSDFLRFLPSSLYVTAAALAGAEFRLATSRCTQRKRGNMGTTERERRGTERFVDNMLA